MASSTFLFQLLMLSMIQPEVQSSCPAPCECVFTDFLPESRSTCVMGDSAVNMTWSETVELTITCRGTNLTCENLPQFDVMVDRAKVVVDSCSPSIMRCVHGIVRPLSTIMAIDVHKLSGQYTGEDFKSFDQLHLLYIDLKDTDEEIPTVAINSVHSLQQLIIVGGNLQLHSNVFNQSRIRYFQLEYNKIRSIPADAFNGLGNLRELSIEGNGIEEIHPDAFRGLNKLEDLYLSHLKIKTVNPAIFLAVQDLAYLSLENTQIQYIPNGFLDTLPKLKMLYIRKNQMDLNLGSKVFARLPHLVHNIVLSECRLRSLPASLFKGSSHLRELSLDSNTIETLPPKMFSDLHSLKEITLRNNFIKMLSKETFAQTKKINTIDLSYNNLKTVSGDLFAFNAELETLILNNNNISKVDVNAFDVMNLNKLDLSSNKLQRISVEGKLSWKIRRLNLSNNQISDFEGWFSRINLLMHLDLTNNQITAIKESDIFAFKWMTIIDLRNNQLSKILREPSLAKSFKPKGKLRLYLSNNPLECDCVGITILKEWKKHNILADYKDITCNDLRKLSVITDKEASYICNKQNALIGLIGSTSFGTLLLILLIISIYARRKKLINYLSIIFNINTRTLTPYEMKQDSLKRYDLFISFAHQDGEFVTDGLLVKLENEFGQKVCVHYRDWVVGDLIPDQIIQSVESSRMTAIILTEHFLESEWSYLEFRTAHNLSIQEGKPRVIIILLNENILQHEKLCDDLKSYIVVNSYLLWGNEDFWEKLQEMLPKGQINRKDKRQTNHNLPLCGC